MRLQLTGVAKSWDRESVAAFVNYLHGAVPLGEPTGIIVIIESAKDIDKLNGACYIELTFAEAVSLARRLLAAAGENL